MQRYRTVQSVQGFAPSGKYRKLKMAGTGLKIAVAAAALLALMLV